MASRRVIADSDDEDGDDQPLTPLREDTREDAEMPPEIEPLSPQLPDTQKPTSGTTDQSFFASVYDEQQSRAFEQSQLIEQIVRRSQKASGSSSEVPHPVKDKARKSDASSATDVTAPIILDNLGNQPPLFNNSASGATTPRKGVPSEWDVPSSAEAAPSSRTAKNSKGKEKSYGKQKRTPSKIIGSSAAAEMFMGNGVTHETYPTNHDTPAPINFYIAQSNLTTMQKLEYQRVNVSQKSQNGYSGLPVSHSNPKSSGVSTVAYSTPSRYASSGPPLPWERSPMPIPMADAIVDTQPLETSTVINIPSSPDVIAADHHGNAPMADMGLPYFSTRTAPYEVDAPVGDSTMCDPPNKKRKKTPKDTLDEDELAQDQPWALDNDNDKQDEQDSHKRRRRSEHISNSPIVNEEDGDIELIPHPRDEEHPREVEREEPLQEEPYKVDERIPEIPATEQPIPAIMPEPIQLDAQPTPQPKKRGRKKKQPMSEQIILDDVLVQNQATAQDLNTAANISEVPIEPGKTKKRRGRPRKSDPAKTEILVAPQLEPAIPETVENDPCGEEPTGITGTTKKSKKKKKAEKQEEEGVAPSEPIANEIEDRDASPLKEISSNSRTPSHRSMPTEVLPAKAVAESPANPTLPPKSEEKARAIPKPTSTASQSKVPYRVGLSKRTRIASLLKVIKR
ncbi:hypothetical protein F5B19DRAFT_264701 [Rostrohypoxylon terebratum]|nr:hypothetical protein F5B19DRAFT_264701 [Rostrohypoxylon terebratum]